MKIDKIAEKRTIEWQKGIVTLWVGDSHKGIFQVHLDNFGILGTKDGLMELYGAKFSNILTSENRHAYVWNSKEVENNEDEE